MWGFGGRWYWGRRERRKRDGIVVMFAWMSSEEKHLRSFVNLYSSLGWDSLVCHSQFLNMFFPEKATTLATDIINELVQELKVKPCPVVFASFSGGPKACMYQVLQILEEFCESKLNPDDRRLVKDCISAYVYDSSPVDFTSDLGTKFVLHPSVLKMSHPPRVASWVAHGIASGLDALFLSRFESQRAEYWQTLYSTVGMKAPYLILCSENDDLSPNQVIYNFTERLRELGADVKLVRFNDSPHVGHFKHYPIDYKAAVTELLGKAAGVYSQKARQLQGESLCVQAGHDDVIEPISSLRKAAGASNGFRGVTLVSSDDFFPTSTEYYGVGSVQDEGVIHLSDPSSPSISAHGVLGQVLFDVCVPKTIEDWDIKSSSLNGNGRSFNFRRRQAPIPIKSIRRSRLSQLSKLPVWSATDFRSLLSAFSGCHVVFHAAALVEPWLPNPSQFFSVNVGGLQNVLRAVRETKTVKKVVYTSSFFALGPTDGHVADESQFHHQRFFCSEYEKSKAAADKIALQAAQEEGLPMVVLYPGVIYGPGKLTAGNLVARIIIERFNGRLPGYIGSGSDRYSFSHVDDVVDGHIGAMEKGRVGERYLLTGENASFKNVFDVAAVLTQTRRPKFNIPLWLIEVYGWVSVLVSHVTGKLPLISPPTVNVLRHQWAYSCDKAKQELDYNPRSLKEGLEEMLPWLKNLGLIKY